MDEVKRARVPFRRTPPPQTSAIGSATQVAEAKAAAIRLKPRRKLDTANAAAFRGNVLTGATLDARKDLPPFCFNPEPKKVMEHRRARLERTYAPPAGIAAHPSGEMTFKLILDPKTRQAAKLQRLLNVNPLVRAEFERQTVTKVLPDSRSDGAISLLPPGTSVGAISSSSQAMTSAPERNMYDMLNQLDHMVVAQAAQVEAQSSQNAGSSYSGLPAFPLGSGLGITDGSSTAGPTGLSDPDPNADGDSDTGSSSSAMTLDPATTSTSVGGLSVGTSNTTTPQSTDEGASKVEIAVQHLNQMYSLVSTMFSKYNQSSMAAINNIK